MPDLPRIAITMGDPAGIGPEIIAKALLMPDIYEVCRPLVLGDIGCLEIASRGVGYLSFQRISNTSEATGRQGLIDVMSVSELRADSCLPGQPTKTGGKAMVDYVLKAVKLCEGRNVAAMVTCPISKELMHQAGYEFEGHTELLAHLTGTKDYVMMLAGDRLRVSLVTIHCALAEVPGRLSEALIVKTISITYRALERDFGIDKPRIAVAALNPHAGESGLFGMEDKTIVAPAVGAARDSGLSVEGPFASDTIFYHASTGRYDAVVAMYHDQGLIALKLLHFSDAVNITLGLPIIRTSVDHGTAYDIAGKGVADPSSLVAAIKMAARIVGARRKAQG
ncbi:MAG: 4-hydroxythreonine-4-phosphate dehydrogenase PdxA [Deltaproteobacteria bacterium]|nr:MAG: 4-hydroxythreonine-4-phosphate dehydrogenase PdxA [Deltaproteobacteria bacterium]